ncbi:MAG: HAMP domain-containing histidine kinase [Oscillospiraceae bacterium]|jgi:signal transduction histidine kinase|nr:HAMP domain-containing histidine kinase [Oscillospiraceae bacterium]
MPAALQKWKDYRQTASLRSKVRLWLAGFAALLLLALWVLQFALFNPLYESMRVGDLRRTGRRLAAAYNQDANAADLAAAAFSQNMRVLVIDSSGYVMSNYDSFGSQGPGGGRIRLAIEEQDAIRDYLQSGQTREFAEILNSRIAKAAVYIARLETKAASSDQERYLFLSTPVPQTDGMVEVHKAQFWMITAILAVLSMGGAWLLSRQIERIHRETEEVKRSETWMRELLANVTHDFKTPLSVIKLYAEMLRDMDSADTRKCEKIISESDKLSGMVSEMLEFSRQKSGAEMPMETVDFSQITAAAAGRFSPEKVIIECRIQPGLFVHGNAPALERTVHNLIANAVNYGGADKWVGVRLYAQGNEAILEVADHGEGIAEEEIPRIWERYYKSDNVTRRGAEGTGLGLAIVSETVARHGGRRGVQSSLGLGSLFWIALPVKRQEA